jgi:FtsZ-binding cell division protein ZapB
VNGPNRHLTDREFLHHIAIEQPFLAQQRVLEIMERLTELTDDDSVCHELQCRYDALEEDHSELRLKHERLREQYDALLFRMEGLQK